MCVFFRRGLTIAYLNTVGNVPESSDWFTTWVSAGTISSEQSNKRDVGIGSRSHVLQAIFFKRAETAVSLTALKWVSGFPEEKKLISKTRGSSAGATVNVLSYGADFLTEEVGKPLRELSNRHRCWYYSRVSLSQKIVLCM